MRELPVLGRPPAERADAARNRRRILRAAAEVLAARGPDAVTMDEVAKAAGVGVGTVYRRFGDRARLVYAVIDDRERAFQAALLHALADRTEAQADLLLRAEADPPDARFRDGSYGLYHMHLGMLLARIRPGSDTAYLADALLAPFAATLFLYQRRTRGMPLDRVKAGLDALAAGLTGGGTAALTGGDTPS
ncbi:helix-turn-helix domain-containing protein [Actinomadura geliboluensis]|uniref:Helix-turn-helix transcriptional regulator n=1 Tax=Actinomadura geliboluensis TaxID=882440 RepID=A0A5S4H2Z2_9ACTN|nr:TetR/AcrR family transcriptional regulator [Actinomadura geliboluensis]TMR39507.1 helix-turn-helix transcriptional regulator [Actinomadura geliboluensis]